MSPMSSNASASEEKIIMDRYEILFYKVPWFALEDYFQV